MFYIKYILKAATFEKMVVMDPNIIDNSRNTHAEETELPIQELRTEMRNIDINQNIEDEDLLETGDPLNESHPYRNNADLPSAIVP